MIAIGQLLRNERIGAVKSYEIDDGSLTFPSLEVSNSSDGFEWIAARGFFIMTFYLPSEIAGLGDVCNQLCIVFENDPSPTQEC